jgi:hypothetical protein
MFWVNVGCYSSSNDFYCARSNCIITPSELVGSHFVNEDCKATVTVSAVEDDIVEGDHYTTILHTVQNCANGEEIMLTDESPLYAANVLVTIYNDDTAGMIIEELYGVTATAELDDTAKGVVGVDSYYKDEYTMRLTKQPAGTVEVRVESIAMASDVGIAATPLEEISTTENKYKLTGSKLTVSFSHQVIGISLLQF